MKAFLVALLALTMLCTLIIWDGVTVNKISDKMGKIASEIKSLENEDKLKELEDAWHKHQLVLSISVPHKVTDELDKSIALLRKKFDEGISTEFPETVALTLKAIEELRVHALVDANNVLFINHNVFFK